MLALDIVKDMCHKSSKWKWLIIVVQCLHSFCYEVSKVERSIGHDTIEHVPNNDGQLLLSFNFYKYILQQDLRPWHQLEEKLRLVTMPGWDLLIMVVGLKNGVLNEDGMNWRLLSISARMIVLYFHEVLGLGEPCIEQVPL